MNTSIYFPHEVLELILSRCPIESVVRFTSVSKSWQSIISDPRFSRTYRIHRSKLSENRNTSLWWATSTRHVYLIRSDEDGRFKTESAMECPDPTPTFIIPSCSCNGIFLLRGIYLHRGKVHILWNPAIRRSATIVGPPTPPHTKPVNPWLRTLYYEQETDDYKIVFVYEKHYAVYSCKYRRWAEARDLPLDVNLFQQEASVDGCFYGKLYGGGGEIVCFDARDGKLHKFRQPDDVKSRDRARLEAVSGRLCLYCLSEDEDGRRRVRVWVMEKKMNGSFENCWRKLVCKESEEAAAYLWRFVPVWLSDEDDVVLKIWVGSERAKAREM